MAIFTPRGLKIGLAVDYSFALMDRLSPTVSPFVILKTTEGIAELPKFFSFLAAIYCFLAGKDYWDIAWIVFVSASLGYAMIYTGNFFIPGAIKASTYFSYVSGLGVLFAVLILVGLFTVGWQGALAFVLGRIGVELVENLVSLIMLKTLRAKGPHYSIAFLEREFFNAYLYHARKVGASLDLAVSPAELAGPGWKRLLVQFMSQWPTVAARFSNEFSRRIVQNNGSGGG